MGRPIATNIETSSSTLNADSVVRLPSSSVLEATISVITATKKRGK